MNYYIVGIKSQLISNHKSLKAMQKPHIHIHTHTHTFYVPSSATGAGVGAGVGAGLGAGVGAGVPGVPKQKSQDTWHFDLTVAPPEVYPSQ